jgi:PAS domain S-box-containing protein
MAEVDPAAKGSRVVVLTPSGRDAPLVCTVLERSGIGVSIVPDMRCLAESILDADAAIVAEESLDPRSCMLLRAALSEQAVWSDIPLIVLGSPHSSSGVEMFEKLGPGANLTLVERPARPFTLITVTRAALRARKRQHLMRDHMTELVTAREALRVHRDELAEARTRLQSTLAAAEIGTWTWDARENRVVADHNLARILGIRQSDADGGSVAAYIERAHPDDRAELGDRLKAALAGADGFEAEFRVLSESGAVRWVLARGRVMRDADGEAFALPGAVVDITERIESERARRALVDQLERQALVFDTALSATPDLGYILDTRCRFVYANRSLLRLLGRGMEEVAGRTFSELGYEPGLAEKLWSQAAHVIRTGEEIRDEATFTSPTGVSGYYDYILVPVRSADGSVDGVVGSTRDISERKRLDDQRAELLVSERTARAEAERVGRLKDEFLSTLSHELRTPLNAISGWVQLLRRGNLSETDQAKAIETISRNTQAQKELIEDLLDMNRIVSGKVRLDMQPTDLGVVVLDAVDSVRPAAAAKDISLVTRVDPTHRPVRGDPTRLQQVVWNLVNNAVKFTPPGGRVRVELERTDKEAVICVSDTGVGIAPEFVPLVFDRFRQGDASSTRRHGGLGLGLSIVKQIVEMHGGRVWATSPGEGLGATFSVAIPGDASPASAGHTQHDGEPPEYKSVSLAGLTVLIVDDDPDGRDIVQRLLQQSDARVLTADSADSADEILTDSAVDILLSDIGMPGRDGYDLIRSVRARDAARLSAIPAAALTAFARPEDRETALQAGYDAHVTKPVDPSELLMVIDHLRTKDPTVSR